MSSFQRLSQNRILFHLLFWAVFISAFTLLLGGKYGYLESLKDVILQALSYGVVIYFNLIFLIPHFLLQKKYWQYGLWLVVALVVIVPMHSAIEYYNFYNVEELAGQVKFFKLGFLSLINICFMLVLTSGLKFGKEWFHEQQKSQELEKQKLQAELKFLKSQINPHFLFNTLNNLYSLTLKKSDKAPEMVLKLSEMMRYMLYDSNEKMVLLEKEVGYLRNYIDLEKLRQNEKTRITLHIDQHINGEMIAPLIFIPFLENSFKHGVNNNIESGWIKVSLTLNDGELCFEVENNKPKKMIDAAGKGIGLQNVKRRLELLYPGKYELKISDEEAIYKTKLKLDLN